MRKIVKEINIYNFEELKENIQNKLISDFGEILINDNFEFLEEDLSRKLEEDYKMNDYKIEYSLSYSQGDGLCFYNNQYNLLSYTVLKNNDIKNANVFEKYLIENNLVNDILLNYLNDGYNLGIFKSDSRYTHAHTCNIDYEYYYNNDLGLEEQTSINDCIAQFKNELYKIYLNICIELEKYGYKCYDVSDNEVKSYIIDNEYEFLENGKIYQE